MSRVNVYLKDDANRALAVLFTRLQKAGEIPRNATVDEIGKYRAQIITYALLQTAKDVKSEGYSEKQVD